MSRVLVLAGAFLLGSACGGPSASHPVGAIEVYARALEVGDYDKAYELMSERYKKEHSREDFVRLMRESPREVKETAERLQRGKRSADVRATYAYDELRDELRLSLQDGAWRIDENPLDFYPQDEPRAALRSFIRAVELGRYDVLVRFVPKAYAMSREELEKEFRGGRAQEVADLVTKLRAAIDNPIQVDGDQARLLYGDRAEVVFKREDGQWKIEDFQ